MAIELGNDEVEDLVYYLQRAFKKVPPTDPVKKILREMQKSFGRH